MNTEKVWFVTGGSKGLGLSLVKKLLKGGYKVAATSRNGKTLTDVIEPLLQDNFLPLEVDLKDNQSIQQAINATVEHFGRIDVLVNNAGYGIGGAVEEFDEKEMYDGFEINVFAVIKTMQAVMPFFRKQKSGHIINISSIAGFAGASGWAIYAGTKYAVMGLSEVMAEDVKEFGVKVTVVAPGAFRTEFLQDTSVVFAKKHIEGYDAIRASHQKYATLNGTQLGDPDKAADVFIEIVENPNPPVRLFLGSDAYTRAIAKIDLLTNELEHNKQLAFSTDFGR